MDDSILSTGERRVAELLREGLGVEEIAAERDEPVRAVEQSVDRIREKTERAYATLAASPFAAEVAAELDGDVRQRLLAALHG